MISRSTVEHTKTRSSGRSTLENQLMHVGTGPDLGFRAYLGRKNLEAKLRHVFISRNSLFMIETPVRI